MRVVLLGTVMLAVAIAAPTARPAPPPQAAAVQPAPPPQAAAVQPATPQLSDEQIERFLKDAKIVKTKGIGKGVTGSVRATLTDGTITHDAQIQQIEEKKATFDAPGAQEFNFEDSWRYNVAAYRVNKMIGLNMVPVSVSRIWQSKQGAFTWWIDDVMMDEGKRLKDKTEPPDSGLWNEQMQLVRVFDQLIYNVDRNVGNLLICKNWRIWAIDHTRSFRTQAALKSASQITRCDRRVLEGLKTLDKASLKTEIGEFVNDYQINGLLARRDRILEVLQKAGPAALFDRRAN
jgi:hypothetical protein